MQSQSQPSDHRLVIRGMELPALLTQLLAAGRWAYPGGDVIRSVMPWFEEPITFLATVGGMDAESRSLDMDANDRRSSEIFHVTRGSRSGPTDLPWLDAELAVLIAVNRIPGDDVAIALDYRSGEHDPRVVASDVWTDPAAHVWRLVTQDFASFAAALGL